MLIGAHVSTAGGLLSAFRRATDMGADAVQIFCLSPRAWKGPRPSDEVLASYRETQPTTTVQATFCHAPYLINLATEKEELAEKSFTNLVDNLTVATLLGSSGVVLHVGSHLGRGTDSVLVELGATIERALDRAGELAGEESCPLLLENTAGAGGTIGRSFEELGSIFDAAKRDERLGVCLDTQHLFASGVSYATNDEADAVVAALDEAVGLSRLRCIHLNDSKTELGANKDRHENLGEGLIGRAALGALLSHPALDEVPAVLEVPGDGDGPREVDVVAAREILAAGLAARAGR